MARRFPRVCRSEKQRRPARRKRSCVRWRLRNNAAVAGGPKENFDIASLLSPELQAKIPSDKRPPFEIDAYPGAAPERIRAIDCFFRMLDPSEVAAAMAFPDGYIPLIHPVTGKDLTKRDRMKLAGNAVTPPVMAWIKVSLRSKIKFILFDKLYK